jgi:hypothetical protein
MRGPCWGESMTFASQDSLILPRARRGVAALTALAVTVLFASTPAQADLVTANGGYHAQVTAYFCAAASVEMALDVPAVTNTNAIVTQMLAAGDGPTLPFFSQPPVAGIAIVNGVGVVTSGAQAFIYGLNHGTNTVNGLGYFNPQLPARFPNGTDMPGMVTALNLLDNPNANGALNPAFAFGNHQYAGYNLANQGLANRTIADALQDYQVPAVAVIEGGAHAISVFGVTTTAPVVRNQNYAVTGVLVHDPWTGWAVSQALRGNVVPTDRFSRPMLGLGYNSFFSYGFVQLRNGALVALPWTILFNASPGQSGAAGFSSAGYKFVVEPLGPEPPDAGDPAGDFGIPTPPALLASPLTSGAAADTAALSDLAANPTLAADIELVGGQFDIADALFVSEGPGDWLIPYDGLGGINDVTGAVLIDSLTGLIDAATWIDPSNSSEMPYSLAQIDAMFQDIADGDLPMDNLVPTVPEPTSALLFGCAAVGLLAARAQFIRRR